MPYDFDSDPWFQQANESIKNDPFFTEAKKRWANDPFFNRPKIAEIIIDMPELLDPNKPWSKAYKTQVLEYLTALKNLKK